MNSISNAASAARMSTSSAPVRDQMAVGVEKMKQDADKAEGKMAQRLMSTAAEVQMTGKGGSVDERG